jgi:hypothetical protein
MNDVKRWVPGQSGNPAGRSIGARSRFTEAFVGDVARVWEQHGASVLENMVASEPAKFADLCSRLIPLEA